MVHGGILSDEAGTPEEGADDQDNAAFKLSVYKYHSFVSDIWIDFALVWPMCMSISTKDKICCGDII
jgi:hypothetical protein